MEFLVSPLHLWSMSLVHVWWLLGIHDDIDGHMKRKTIHHLCDLLLRNAVLVPPEGKQQSDIMQVCTTLCTGM